MLLSLVLPASACDAASIVGWSAVAPLPSRRESFAVAVVADRIYVAGGWSTLGATRDAHVAEVNPVTGALSWRDVARLPRPTERPGGATDGVRVFVAGGDDGAALADEVYVGTPAANGDLGSWVTTNPLPVPTSTLGLAASSDVLYVVGGLTGGQWRATSAVWGAPILANGTLGAWVALAALPQARSAAGVAVVDGVLWVVGGLDGAGNGLPGVLAAPIAPNGTLGAFAPVVALPQGLSPALAREGDELFVLGGLSGGFNGSTTVGSASAAGGVAGPPSLGAPLPVARFGHGAAIAGGHAYVMGGYQGIGQLVATVLAADACP